jgi:hypothetical protein
VDAELVEILLGHFAAGVMRVALVTLAKYGKRTPFRTLS